MKQYPEYKDSGIEWIGKTPNHWDFGIMKYRLSANDGGVWGSDCDDDSIGTLVVRSTEITIDGKWDLSNPMKRNLDDKEKTKFKLFKGDIIITKSSGSPDHIGKSVIVDDYVEKLDCCFSNFVQRIRFDKDLPLLYHYMLNSEIVREQYRFLTHSTTGLGNLSSSTFNNINIPYIPLPEQPQIANFLDHKTRQIDDLIAKKQSLIELLKEERTAIINQAVTKGIDTTVPMRDSGINWLGDIPEHWEVKRLKFLAKTIQTGNTPPSEKIEYYENPDVDWFTPSDFGENLFLSDSNRKINFKAITDGVAKLFNPSSVLIIGIGATLGKIGIIEKPASSNQQINSIEFNDMMNPIFGAYFLKTFESAIKNMSNAATLAILNQTNTKGIVLTCPPKKEQDTIVNFILEMYSHVASTITRIEKEIELISEYKTSIINEAVTGKIDVRDYQINHA